MSDAVIEIRAGTEIPVSSPRVWWWRAVVAGVTIACIAMAAATVTSKETLGATSGMLAWLVVAALFAWLGGLIIARQGDGRIGWLLMLIGAALVYGALIEFLVDDLGAVMSPWTWAVLWLGNWAWLLWLFPVFLLLLVFPTGTLLSSRWMWAPILMSVMSVVFLFLSAFERSMGPATGPQTWRLRNPIGFIGGDFAEVLLMPWFVGLLALAIGGVTAMTLRYRRAADVERAQIKWVLFSFMFFAVAYVETFLANSWAEGSTVSLVFLLAGVAGIPASITIAVLKFHLFDIDVIISKSLTFGVLAVFIGGVYVAIVVGIGALLDQGDGSSLWLSVAATAVVAIAFQPVRSRVEAWANRLVYGKRATPYEVLARFSHRAAEESDEDVLNRIPRLIVDGTGASEAALWVRSAGGFRTASVWPQSAASRTIGDNDGFEDPDADLSLPVFHDDELLGGISLVNARGVTTAPPERELLANLAGGLGLTLRNGQLTSALRRQVKDLQRSRDRVVSAADEARRSLEHDLDSGPQQQLVAVKVKLGPVRKLAEQAGATRTAEVLADIEAQAGDAIQAVRDFAAGIYPPLLGAEGLVVALSQETHKAALPVELDANGVGRYPRDIEAAVYFSILEALQNTAKYAEASRAVVSLSEEAGDLCFEIRDDGRGFDTATVRRGAGLSGIGDRIDTIGGRWSVTSKPGSGTVVSGSVPVKDGVPA